MSVDCWRGITIVALPLGSCCFKPCCDWCLKSGGLGGFFGSALSFPLRSRSFFTVFLRRNFFVAGLLFPLSIESSLITSPSSVSLKWNLCCCDANISEFSFNKFEQRWILYIIVCTIVSVDLLPRLIRIFSFVFYYYWVIFSERTTLSSLYAISRPSVVCCRSSVCLWRWCTLLRRLNFSAIFFTIR